jgi:hypothetical protein
MILGMSSLINLDNVDLSYLRGFDKPCDDRDCELLGHCDRCGRHSTTLVEVRPLVFRTVCESCSIETECACGCGETMPKYMMTYTDNYDGGGEWFGPKCCGVEPGETW